MPHSTSEGVRHVDARGEFVFPKSHTILADGERWAAILAHGAFHLRLAVPSQIHRPNYWFRDESKGGHGILYGPIHPSMTPDDIEGATYAHRHGTQWLFAHCSPDEQVDFAARAEAFAFAQFAEAIQLSLAVGALATTNGARNTSAAKTRALVAFARKVGRKIHDQVVGEVLGHYHRNRHIDHKRDLTVAVIRRELQVLRQNQEADADSRAGLGRVENAANSIISRLTSTHTIEWRHERQERLQREALKKAIRGIDPVQSHEYIFTAAATGDSITGAENLPDPAWAMDKAELVNGITRGTQVWYDGYPKNLSPERPFAIAYRRVPSAGSEWVFVQSFRIYV